MGVNAAKTFSVLSWNVQSTFRRPPALRWDTVWHLVAGYTPFSKVLPILMGGLNGIVVLQEMHDAEIKLAQDQRFSEYHIFIPVLNSKIHHGKKGFNSNVILSKFPIVAAREIVFPDTKKNTENCTCVDIEVERQIVRIYACHFPVFGVGAATRLTYLKYITSDAAAHAGPVIICGDLNTAIPASGSRRIMVRLWHQVFRSELLVAGQVPKEDERFLLKEALESSGFHDVLDIDMPTWSPFKSNRLELFGLKLDWLAVKGAHVETVEVGEYISDHRSILTTCRLL